MKRRQFLAAASAAAGMVQMPWLSAAARGEAADKILVAVELSGGNDGLNTIVPFADDAYYQRRPTLGIKRTATLELDDFYGFNPGMLGLQRLWQSGDLAIVHGCGYERPSYSHFNAMAYWHTGVPHRGDEFGWMGRVADQIAHRRQDDLLINIGSQQSLAVKSARHTPLVFDDPQRFQRDRWMSDIPADAITSVTSKNDARAFLRAVNQSAQISSQRIRQAWEAYQSPIDYGIAPMDLPKVAACIDAGLSTPLYHVSFRNNAFDTHVQQPALHRRLLSYACDGIHGFIQDLERMGHADRVVVMVYSEFGRRVPENANLGTDHGSANVMFLAGRPVRGGHYGRQPSLTDLVDGDNMAYTLDFRSVYATAIQGWLGVAASPVLKQPFEILPIFSAA